MGMPLLPSTFAAQCENTSVGGSLHQFLSCSSLHTSAAWAAHVSAESPAFSSANLLPTFSWLLPPSSPDRKQKPWACLLWAVFVTIPQASLHKAVAMLWGWTLQWWETKPLHNFPPAPSHSHQDVSTPPPVRAAECVPSPCEPSKAPTENMSVLLLLPFPASAPALFYSISPQRCNQEDLLTWKSLDSSPESSLLNFCLILPVLRNLSLPQALTPISACCGP